MVDGHAVRRHVLQHFGNRVRASRRDPEALVLDEVGELVVREQEGRGGIRLVLAGGAVLDEVRGVDLTDLGTRRQLWKALRALGGWANDLTDPRWSPEDAELVHRAVELLRGDRRRDLGLPEVSYFPLTRTGTAYEVLRVQVSATPGSFDGPGGVLVRIRSPFWRKRGIPLFRRGRDDLEVSFIHELAIDQPDDTDASLAEAFDSAVRRILPESFMTAYGVAYEQFVADPPAGPWETKWGWIRGADGPPVASDKDVDIPALVALVTQRFGNRVSPPRFRQRRDLQRVRWTLDEHFEFGFVFEERHFGAVMVMPNGVSTSSLFGVQIVSGRERQDVAGALDRIDTYVRLLQGQAAT